MKGYNEITVKKIALCVVLLLAVVLGGVLRCDCYGAEPSYSGSDHGDGAPPAEANRGEAAVWNDPNDDGRGPETGDGTTDTADWNAGCGNEEDRADDNEGLCGKPKPVPPAIITPKIIERRTCKAVFIGETPEIWEAGIDVHDPANEVHVIAEAHDYLELTFEEGFEGTVMWYQEATGHQSIVQGFVCTGEEIVLVEPFTLGDNME